MVTAMSASSEPSLTGIVYDDRFLLHDTGPTAPERPDRLRRIVEVLKQDGLWPRLHRILFAAADRHQLRRLHREAYLDRLDAACANGSLYLDDIDSTICPASADVARLAVGGILRAIDEVAAGRLANAFCAIRPPGHHAEAERSMGYCLFANAALAADSLTRDGRCERVAVIDFDVHHGNSTQNLFEDRADVMAISLHGDPVETYPGTGFTHETGLGAGEGTTLNILMPAGSDDRAYAHAVQTQVVPALESFKPDFLILASGFDAATEDPLASMRVTTEGFRVMTHLLLEAADRLCGGRVVSILEGGYHLDALSAGVSAHVRELIKHGKLNDAQLAVTQAD